MGCGRTRVLRSRITSYNVCYTKLLRSVTGGIKTAVNLGATNSVTVGVNTSVITSYSIHYTKLYEEEAETKDMHKASSDMA